MQLAVNRVRSQRAALIATGVTAGVAITAMLAVLLVMMATRDTRQDINLGDFAHSSSQFRALNGYEEATEKLCRDVAGCVQGYSATYASYRKFSSIDDAVAFAATSSGSYRSNWIVIEYVGHSLSEGDRADVQEYFDSTATSE
ncbi:hypothetical protein AB6V29_13615 [Microbacterium sp. 20-116]|uniref:hypothetical protein n=1 Tax=unclassified Microbacterium TaxID=2609290 RepID=UPI00226EA5BA|nr:MULTISPECIES: hypothetical protein [unclassified Microbacterium]MDQ1176423.1 hypothetical protein [Microbacterium sp. SORGH_AS_0421]WAC70350.1 hypothetical protein OVA17_06550 [Microbacterium sp. SL75]